MLRYLNQGRLPHIYLSENYQDELKNYSTTPHKRRGIKSTDLLQEKHLKGLKALREEGKVKNFAVISNDPVERTVDNIHIYPWKIALEKLWKNAF